MSSTSRTAYVSVREGYERWAPLYDHAPNPLLALEGRCTVPLLPTMTGRRVLDLACGTGRWQDVLSRHGASQVIGIDASNVMLRAAASRTMPGRQLALADCCELPFSAEIFGFAICSFALAHIRQPWAMARECARVLACGAELFISDLHPRAYAVGWRTGFRDGETLVEIETFLHAPQETHECFRSAGFVCDGCHSFSFGEPERSIFIRSGKERVFDELRLVPAVILWRFRRAAKFE